MKLNLTIKIGLFLLVAYTAANSLQAQGTKILSIYDIDQLEPIIMNDTTNFFVIVSVDDTSATDQDSIFGDLFYYYLTDSMISAGTPPRIINNSLASIWIPDGFNDTVSIDIRPDETRTTPVNLIILWPAMINPEVADTNSLTIFVGFDGYIGIPTFPTVEKKNLVFPCPTIQYIFIRQEELGLIKQIRILSLEGKMINQYEAQEYSNGFINIDYLATGNYLIELNYFNNNVIRTKILKR